MQNRSYARTVIKYVEKSLPDEFPLAFYRRKPAFNNSKGLHFHNGIEIGYCYEGSGLFFVYNKILPFSKGDAIILFPDQPHVAQSSTENPCNWNFLTSDIERLFHDTTIAKYEPVSDILCNKLRVPNVIKCSDHSDICELVRQIFLELENQPTGYQLTVKALLWAFFLKLSRMTDSLEKQILLGDTGHAFASITPAIEYISLNYNQEVPMPTLSSLCFLSTAQFVRNFKKVMQRTPIEYITQVRIRMATTLLKTTALSISEIALSVGYQSISSFNRNFQTLKHTTPRDYRNKYR